MTYAFLPPLAPEPRGRTTERVARILRHAVVELNFLPGEFIDKVALCQRLGVSRFPISEALSQLAAEGLVEILPQRGTRVARIRLSEVREAMMIRRALEAAVAEEAASRLTDAAINRMHTNLAEQQSATENNDRLAFHRLDVAFHEELVGDLGLARVGAAIDGSRAIIDRMRRLLASPRRLAATLGEHQALLDAIAARDSRAARAAMEGHLDAVRSELERFHADHPDAFDD